MKPLLWSNLPDECSGHWAFSGSLTIHSDNADPEALLTLTLDISSLTQ